MVWTRVEKASVCVTTIEKYRGGKCLAFLDIFMYFYLLRLNLFVCLCCGIICYVMLCTVLEILNNKRVPTNYECIIDLRASRYYTRLHHNMQVSLSTDEDGR